MYFFNDSNSFNIILQQRTWLNFSTYGKIKITQFFGSHARTKYCPNFTIHLRFEEHS